MALYGRAKSLMALGQLEQALVDATRVVSLKPQWPKVGETNRIFEMLIIGMKHSFRDFCVAAKSILR